MIEIRKIKDTVAEIVRFSDYEMKYFEMESFQKAWESYARKGQELTFAYLEENHKVIGILGWIYDSVDNSSSLKNAGFDSTKRYTWLMAIGIDQKYRGKKLANLLMKYYIKEVKKNGAQILGLRVDPKNEKAIKLYKKFDFVEYERFDNNLMMWRKA